MVTRLFNPMVSVIKGSRPLSLLPLSFVQHLVASGELAVPPVGEPFPLQPIGLLQPQGEMPEAAGVLAEFLRRPAAGPFNPP